MGERETSCRNIYIYVFIYVFTGQRRFSIVSTCTRVDGMQGALGNKVKTLSKGSMCEYATEAM